MERQSSDGGSSGHDHVLLQVLKKKNMIINTGQIPQHLDRIVAPESSMSADRSASLQDQNKSYDRAALIDLERLILICKDNLSLIVCYIENFALLIYFQLTLSLSSLSGTRETRWRSSESRSFQHKIHRIPKQKVGEFLSLKGPFTNYVTHPQYHIIYCLKFIKFI